MRIAPGAKSILVPSEYAKAEKPGKFQRNPFESIKAKCTVLVIQIFLPQCAQPHENGLHILPHINLYLSMRQGPHPHSPSHVRTCFLKFRISKNSVFQDQEFFSKNRPKNHQKNRGAQPLNTRLYPSSPPRCVLNVRPQWYWITESVHIAVTGKTAAENLLFKEKQALKFIYLF